MACRICKSFEQRMGICSPSTPGLCKFPHGHTRKVEFVLETDDLDAHEIMDDYLVRRRGG